MLRGIVVGMRYLVDMGYVYRDFVVCNIFVNSNFVCKVLDFGLFWVIEDDLEVVYIIIGGKILVRWIVFEVI